MGKEQQFRDEGGRGTPTIGGVEKPREQVEETKGFRRSSEAESKATVEEIEGEYNLAELLSAADEAIATPPPRSAEEIDEKAATFESLEKRLERLHSISESRVERLERIEKRGVPELSASDYEELEKNNVSAEFLRKYKEVQEKLSVMEAKSKERTDSSFREVIGRLAEAESKIRETIEKTVSAAATERWNERVAKARKTMDEHYGKRAGELESIVNELRADPEVAKRHKERIEETQRKAREEELKGHQAFLEEITLKVDLLSQQQNAVLKRMEQIAGTSTLSNPKETRQAIIAAILDGKGGGQIKSAEEVLPWKRMDTGRYYDSLNFLLNPNTRASLKKLADAGDQDAITTLERLGAVTKTHDRLKDIENNEFWAAFNQRAKNDRAEEARRLEEARKQHETQKEKMEAEVRGVVERGGFRVNVPGDAVREARKEGGGGLGAVRLEVKKSKKGNVYLEVVEVAGSVAKVLNNHSVSLAHAYGATVNVPQFPQWLQKQITNNGELANKIEELRWQR